MSSSIYNQINQMQTYTNMMKAQEAAEKGPVQELNQDAFLMLLMEQIKNQDPLEPMDNSQMVAQQAQFTQISELQKLNESISNNNQVMQGSAMIGKYVSVFDPDNPGGVVSGWCTEANFSNTGVTIVIDGKSYPLSHVFSAMNDKPAEKPAEEDDGKAEDDGTESSQAA